jgi:nucleoid-associated protein YgaU
MPSAPQLEAVPASNQLTAPRRRSYKIIFSAALIAIAATFIAPIANAQDLGEIARQERAKKQDSPTPAAAHVYTNEDVKRQEILTPDDKTRFSATTKPATVKPAQSTPQLASESTSAPAELIGPQITAPVSVQTLQPSATVNVTTTQALAQIPVAQDLARDTSGAPPSAAIPQEQVPLGDVARFYRLMKHESARANPQTDPGRANVPTKPESAKTIPNPIPSDQMSLGDVARYYRAKQREESEANANQPLPIYIEAKPVPVIVASTIQARSAPSAGQTAHAKPTSAYPLMLATMPLASIKPPPARALPPNSSRIVPTPNHSIAHPTTTHGLVAPKRSVGGNATSIRISSGDTLWQLARKYLGSATRWHELAALNPTLKDPRRLQIGVQLIIHPSTT